MDEPKKTDALAPIRKSIRLESLGNDELLGRLLAQKTKKTAENYQRDFVVFAEFCQIDPPADAIRAFLDLSGHEANDVMLRYVDWLRKTKGYASGTISRRINAMRSVVKTARLLGWITWAIEIPHVRVRRTKEPGVLRGDAFEAILRVIEAEQARLLAVGTQRARAGARACLRDAALVMLLRGSGVRRAEALSIDWPAHVDALDCRVSVVPKGGGGSETEREWQPTSRASIDAILDYVEDGRGGHQGSAMPSGEPGPLFVSSWGKRTTRLDLSTVNRRLTRWGKAAGLRVTPHMFRHGVVTDILEETGDIEKAGHFARHRSLQVTRGYSHRIRKSNEIADALTKRKGGKPS